MTYKKAVVSIIALVVVTWVLISSLSAIPVMNSQSGGSGTGHGTGTGTGSGSGTGTGSLFGFHFPTLNLHLPNFNIGSAFANLLSKLHITLPKLNITLPQTGAKANSTSSSPGGGNTGSGTTTNTKHDVTPVVINPLFLEIFMVIFIAMAVILVAKSTFNRKKTGKPDQPDTGEELFEYNSREGKEENGAVESGGSPDQKTLDPRAIPQANSFLSWNGNGLIKPKIPDDMPLLAKAGESLDISCPEDMKLFSNGTELSMNKNALIVKGRNLLTGQSHSGNDTKTITGIDPMEDSQRQMIANFGESILNRNRTKTLREIILESDLSSLISNKEKLISAIGIYEKIYYGRKNINMNDYYEFLRSLRDALREPKVFMQ